MKVYDKTDVEAASKLCGLQYPLPVERLTLEHPLVVTRQGNPANLVKFVVANL